MLSTRSPISILAEDMAGLVAILPALRDGSEVAIHDARVATRRIVETLALVRPSFDESEYNDVHAAVRRLRRALGSARDADVVLQLLAELDGRLPSAAAVTARVRASLVGVQQQSRRRLIKKLERLDLAGASNRVKTARRYARLPFRRRGPDWRQRLRLQIVSHATVVREAIHRTGGVYFPKRSHSTRMAIKELRYALELANRTRLWQPTRAIRRLRKAQEVLGQAHDRQLLIDHMPRSVSAGLPAATPETDAVIGFLEAEARALHSKYLDWRPELLAICGECARAASPSPVPSLMLAAGLAVSPFLLLKRRTDTTGRPSSGQSDPMRVNVRIQKEEEPVA
jgi:CHAD domain-containing protein